MSYKKVIKKTKKIETLLGEMGATGQGLHQKVSSIEHTIDEKTVKSIRFIASIRNKLLHEDGFEITPSLLDDFENACENVIDDLKAHSSTKKQDYCNRTNEKIKDKPYESKYNSKKSNSSSSKKSNSSSLKDNDEVSGLKLLELGIAGAIAVYSWFNS